MTLHITNKTGSEILILHEGKETWLERDTPILRAKVHTTLEHKVDTLFTLKKVEFHSACGCTLNGVTDAMYNYLIYQITWNPSPGSYIIDKDGLVSEESHDYLIKWGAFVEHKQLLSAEGFFSAREIIHAAPNISVCSSSPVNTA